MSLKEIFSEVFEKKGTLSRFMPDFELRSAQKHMSEKIFEAYEQDKILLVEAGTGVGKSLAYLIPAILFGAREKTVISTYTIALQEQLVYKDIPFALNALGIELKTSLIKGMSNYVCLKRAEDLSEEHLHFEAWLETTEDGDKSTLETPFPSSLWSQVQAEKESCTRAECSHFKNCFFFKARKEAEDASLVIVNHHLLLADLMMRVKRPEENSILPPFERLIIDEAHHLEEVALESFIERLDPEMFLVLLHQLISDLSTPKGKLVTLKHKLELYFPSQFSLAQKLEIQFLSPKESLCDHVKTCFSLLPLKEKENRWRLIPSQFEEKRWKEEILPQFFDLSFKLKQFTEDLRGCLEEIKLSKQARGHEGVKSSLQEVERILSYLNEIPLFIDQFFDKDEEKSVRWIEVGYSGKIVLVQGQLGVAELLKTHLFERVNTALLCSATLSTRKNFSYMQERLGIEKEAEGVIFDSPFDFEKQALLLIPKNIPSSTSSNYIKALAESIHHSIVSSKGGAFVLFTSYALLKSCYDYVTQIKGEDFEWFKQNDLPRHLLIEKFKKSSKGVLFGTDSFWEGVDVPGEALRAVIMTKLPFKVPTEPLFQAQSEALIKEGIDPFLEYAIPQAIIKFKQGFGRLIRKKTDRGCIVCLDDRLMTKSYGKHFLTSLPSCHVIYDEASVIFSEMKRFYRSFQ